MEAPIFKTIKWYHRQLSLSGFSLQIPSKSRSDYVVVKSLSICVGFTTSSDIFDMWKDRKVEGNHKWRELQILFFCPLPLFTNEIRLLNFKWNSSQSCFFLNIHPQFLQHKEGRQKTKLSCKLSCFGIRFSWSAVLIFIFLKLRTTASR